MRRPWLLSLSPILIAMTLSPVWARGMDWSSLDQYRAHLENLRILVSNCTANAWSGDPNAVGNDEQVHLQGLGVGANVNSFEANYGWLRDALKSARGRG